MQKTSKLYLLMVVIVLLGLGKALGQPVSGYQGKNFLLKTDLINPFVTKTYALELEAIASRSITIGLESTWRWGKFSSEYQADGRMSYRHFVLNWRYYYGGGVLPPVGPYFLLGLGLGTLNLSWVDLPTMYGPGGPGYEKDLIGSYSLGGGVQRVFFRRLTLDFHGCLHYIFDLATLSRDGGYARTGDPYLIPSTFRLQDIFPNSDTYFNMTFFLKAGVLLF